MSLITTIQVQSPANTSLGLTGLTTTIQSKFAGVAHTSTLTTSLGAALSQKVSLINTGFKGDKGDKGDTGDTGPVGTDLHHVHDQMVPSATWTITHALGKTPSVVVIDSGGSEVEGAISYPNITTVVVEFSAAFSGTAYLN